MIVPMTFRRAMRAPAVRTGAAALAGVALSVGLLSSSPVEAAQPTRSLAAVAAAEPSAATVTLPRGWRRAMLVRVNELRARVGAPPLRPCASLRRTAEHYAIAMASADHFGHVGTDGSEPWDRMTREGYRWHDAAENIAAGQRSVDEVMDDWIASPEHYANLVNPNVRDVGFGFSDDPGTTYGSYWVQNFGRGRGC